MTLQRGCHPEPFVGLRINSAKGLQDYIGIRPSA